MKKDPRKFFEQPQGAAVLKHGILRRYLRVFATKASTNSEGHRVVFLDGYAGPGTYRDGTPGSPAIALDVGDDLAEMNRPRDLRCVFVEEDAGLVEDLQTLVAQRRGDHVVHHGTVEDHLDAIAGEVAGMPLFAFLDPFGLGVPLQQLADTLLDRPNVIGGATEVLLNFNLTGLPRFGGVLHSDRPNKAAAAQLKALDTVMGGPEWRDVWDPADSRTSSEAVVALFCDQANKLSKRGWGFYHVGVGDRWNARPDYELILLTAHLDGAWYFNEALSKSLEEFYDYCHPEQRTTEDPKLRAQEWIDEIAGNIMALAKRKSFRLKDEISEVYGTTIGFARETHVRSAIKQLHKAGRVAHTGVGKNVDNFYIERATS